MSSITPHSRFVPTIYSRVFAAGLLLALQACVAQDPPPAASSSAALSSSSAISSSQPASSSSSLQSSSSSSSSVAPISSSSSSAASSSESNLISVRPNSGSRQITVKGQARTYHVYVPASYPTNRRVPLVLRYHGIGGNGGQEINSNGYRAIADREGFILVAPSGSQAGGFSGGAWNVGTCCTADRNIDDVAFAKAIIADVASYANIDRKRVYATGFSMGGGMTHYLACHASDEIAAFAPEAFDLLQENVGQCQPSRPVPVLSQRATNDSLVIYNGGEDCLTGVCINFLGAVETNRVWREKNQCTNEQRFDNNCQINTQCSDGVEVGLCTLSNGHSPASAETGWAFLKQFQLP